MDTLIEKFDIETINVEDNHSTDWSMIWTNGHGGLVSENGKTYSELVKALEWGQKLDGYDFNIVVGGGFQFEE